MSKLELAVIRLTGFDSLEDYRAYLSQLATDHIESGHPATAQDYRTMRDLLDAVAE